jgi:hypothetical protein
MKLFSVHCGFYDPEVLDGIYESHVNLFVVAESFEEARAKAKLEPVFKGKRMHVDGIQELEAVQGFRILLQADSSLEGSSRIVGSRHRDLAPKPSS